MRHGPCPRECPTMITTRIYLELHEIEHPLL